VKCIVFIKYKLTFLHKVIKYGINFEPIKMNVTFQETNENIN